MQRNILEEMEYDILNFVFITLTFFYSGPEQKNNTLVFLPYSHCYI